MEADSYDYLPIRGWWVDEDDKPLPPERAPVGSGFQNSPGPNGAENTWMCFPGWREYHDHHSHQDVSWNRLRGNPQYRPLALMVQLRKDLDKIEGCG